MTQCSNDTDILNEKSLDDAIDGYVKGRYNFTQLKIYMDWNEFTLADIDFNAIYKAKLSNLLKKRITQ